MKQSTNWFRRQFPLEKCAFDDKCHKHYLQTKSFYCRVKCIVKLRNLKNWFELASTTLISFLIFPNLQTNAGWKYINIYMRKKTFSWCHRNDIYLQEAFRFRKLQLRENVKALNERRSRTFTDLIVVVYVSSIVCKCRPKKLINIALDFALLHKSILYEFLWWRAYYYFTRNFNVVKFFFINI